MKKALLAAAALVALPVMAQAQGLSPGFYIGAEGGVNWLLNTTILGAGVQPQTGFAAGGVIGYDFIGPRVELEGVYRQNQVSINAANPMYPVQPVAAKSSYESTGALATDPVPSPTPTPATAMLFSLS